MIRALRAGWPRYRADLAWSVRAWPAYPLIPALSVGLALLALVPDPWFWLTLPVAILGLGWPGTERMLYLRTSRGLPLLRSELVPFTRAYVGRFFVLALCAMAAMSGLALVFLISRDPTVHLLAVTAGAFVLAVFLTFVTPALAYSTRRVTIAVRMGQRLLADTWPASAWYALVPPLTAVAVLWLVRATVPGLRGRLALTAAWTLLNLCFKGAAAAFYLRTHPAGDDGAAHASSWELLDPHTGQPRRPEL